MGIGHENRRIDEDVFMGMREPVLALWPTGREVDLADAVEYQRNLPASKSFLDNVRRLRQEGRTVVFPRGGTPVLEDQISLCRKMVQMEIPFIPVTTDSYTRQLQLKKAEDGLMESVRTGRPMLNGYPLINHGVKATRKLVESVDKGAFSPRLSRLCYPLASEIALAAGMTGLALSAFVSFGAYEKNCSLADSVAQCQYVARLIGYYAANGVVITTDLHGWIPTSVFPLSVNLATMIADALICRGAGRQERCPPGPQHGQPRPGPRVDQGDAPSPEGIPRPVRLPGRDRARRFRGPDAALSYAPGHGARLRLPRTTPPILAALGKVESVFLRTIDEGAGVPTEEAHALSYASANWLFRIIREQHIEFDIARGRRGGGYRGDGDQGHPGRLLEMGDGDIVKGSVKGVEAGIIDSFFQPEQARQGLVTGVKDSQGAVRYAVFGNLPIPEAAREFHRRKLAERQKRKKGKWTTPWRSKIFGPSAKGS